MNAYMNLLAAIEKLHTADASVELSKAEFEHYVRTFSCNLFSSCLVLRRLDEKEAEA